MARLENWSVHFGFTWVKPDGDGVEVPKMRLRGLVTNHDKFTDDEEILSSPVTELDPHGNFARSMNTVFELGLPDPKWLEFISSKGLTLENFKLNNKKKER